MIENFKLKQENENLKLKYANIELKLKKKENFENEIIIKYSNLKKSKCPECSSASPLLLSSKNKKKGFPLERIYFSLKMKV